MPTDRNIDTHHDDHGLNESLVISCDERDVEGGGGASHHYVIYRYDHDGGSDYSHESVARIQFQHGPRNVDGSKHGVTEAALYAVLIDRMEAFQAGPFSCASNAEQLAHLRHCLALTKRRADERAARGVLGKNEE